MQLRGGSPSPADSFGEERLDIARLLVERPSSTFFVHVEGESMVDAQVEPGDILVADRSVTPRHNDLVITQADNEAPTVSVYKDRTRLYLVSASSLLPRVAGPLKILGVVLWIIHKTH